VKVAKNQFPGGQANLEGKKRKRSILLEAIRKSEAGEVGVGRKGEMRFDRGGRRPKGGGRKKDA